MILLFAVLSYLSHISIPPRFHSSFLALASLSNVPNNLLLSSARLSVSLGSKPFDTTILGAQAVLFNKVEILQKE